jgi:hypothetical protein
VVATPARIGFIIEEWRRATSITTETQTRFGSLARKSDDPVETYFDDADDAKTVADARQTLLSPERRRFTVSAIGLDEALALPYTAGTLPVVRYRDAERDADMPALTGRIVFDFQRQRAEFLVWG